jgi:hypothetical protein
MGEFENHEHAHFVFSSQKFPPPMVEQKRV